MVITIAALLNSLCKEFKVITPYDPQRDLLEYMLYEAGLPWMNTVFTVDSFQGVHFYSFYFLKEFHTEYLFIRE